MRVIAAGMLAALALAALALWASGALQVLGFWLAGQQQALQAALAGRIQALRAGEPAALTSLLALCAGYGFLHAAGPGHGKALVAGVAVGTRATALRMAAIALVGSLAQAAVAIAVVFGAFTVFEATARGTVETTERWVAPVGNLVVALVGGWILWRGLRGLQRRRRHGHDHGHAGCGHAHGPSPEQAARADGLGATLALVGAMAVRPCTGAIVVLVIAWRMGLAPQGAAGVVAMGLGTAAFTVLVALLAVTSRDAAFLAAGDGQAARLLAPGLQIVTGGLILGISGLLLLAAVSAGGPVPQGAESQASVIVEVTERYHELTRPLSCSRHPVTNPARATDGRRRAGPPPAGTAGLTGGPACRIGSRGVQGSPCHGLVAADRRRSLRGGLGDRPEVH